jgi:hypothetical protein
MNRYLIGRREVVFAAAAFAVTPAAKAQAEGEPPIHVVKGRVANAVKPGSTTCAIKASP